MNETPTNDGKNKVLSLKGKSSTVRQSFSHGRSKSVVVETKRKRVLVPQNLEKTIQSSITERTVNKSTDFTKETNEIGGVPDIEVNRRIKALETAKALETSRIKQEKVVLAAREEELKELRKQKEKEEINKRSLDQNNQQKVKPEVDQNMAGPLPSEIPLVDAPVTKPRVNKQDDIGKKHLEEDNRQTKTIKNTEDRRRSGKLTITQALGDGNNRHRSIASMKRRQEKEKRQLKANQGEREKVIRDVQIPDVITVQELANRMAERSAAVVKTLMTNGIMATQNQPIDADTAILIAEEFGHRVTRVSASDVEDELIKFDEYDDEVLKARPPVITIMGHVDHGKTSLLDAIRKTNVVSSEAGGITQHIGAYQVQTENGAELTFLDTPGHAAFTSMRARGANVTDIVILVVAADDGVKPQTVEAINHAKAAKVPLIVAINKSDIEGADPNRVRTELLQHEIIVESMSGEVLDVEVSAIKNTGIKTLLENISLQSELLELTANSDRPAEGAVIEAKLDVGRGPVATVLIQKGTLKKGDIFVVGEQWGKVRALINDTSDRIESAGPSVPVEVLGLNGTPEAGDILNVVSDEAKAREIANYRNQLSKDKKATLGAGSSLDQLIAKAKEDKNTSKLPLLIKSDVQGSAEAIVQAMEKLGNEEVQVQVLHSAVGAITESDVTLAEASNAPIIGFNVRANAQARDIANQKRIEIRYYSIIYDLVNDVKTAASGLLTPEIKETFIGYAKIKEVFKITGVGKIAGCIVTEGSAKRDAGVRLLRDNIVIHEGKLKTLKRFKDEVKDVLSGQECGMAFEAYDDIKEDDVIEIFTSEEIKRTLT
ncbi:MAG: translation initiation factor IF-2 [Rhodobacteraceae bacterium]|nr:MAG: translation initiation factor IF-2 [Paracoccaceae bacterium]